MTNKTPKSKPRCGKLKITHEQVMEVFMNSLKRKGPYETEAFFEQMNSNFSVVNGWADTYAVIQEKIAEAKREKEEEEFAKKLALTKASAANLFLMNQNEAYGIKDSRKISNRDVTLTGDHATYEENNQPKE